MSKWVVMNNDHGWGRGATREAAERESMKHAAGWAKPAALEFQALEFDDAANVTVNMMGQINSDITPLSDWDKRGARGQWARVSESVSGR